MPDPQPPPAPEQPGKGIMQKFGWPTVYMLLIIMASIVLVFLGGLIVLVLPFDGVDNAYDAAAIVAVIAPVMTAIGTVAAGVFGYSLGSEGAAEASKTASQAQQVANTATQEAAVAKQEAAAKIDAAVPLIRNVHRILKIQALKDGTPAASGKYEISEDDLKTLTAEGEEVSKKLGLS